MAGIDPDPIVLATSRVLVGEHRASGLDDETIRRLVLDELRANLPEDAFEEHVWESVVAMHQRAVDAALREAR